MAPPRTARLAAAAGLLVLPLCPAAGASLVERPAVVRFVPAAPDAADLSLSPGSLGDLYSARAADIEGILQLSYPFGPDAVSVLDERAREIDGVPYRELSRGGESMGIYMIRRGEEPTVVKALYPTEEGFLESLRDERPRPAEEQWRWAKIGALFNAPDVRRAGKLRAGSQELYFLELGALFSGSGGVSLKDDVYSPGRKRDIASPRPDGRRPSQDMADLLVEVLEHGIVPKDSDFFLSPSREVAWIDSNRWYKDGDIRFEREMDAAAGEVRKWLAWASVDQETYLYFYVDFLMALKRSRRLEERVKFGILRKTFWGADDSAYRHARAAYDAL